jgi:hypothetical protein
VGLLSVVSASIPIEALSGPAPAPAEDTCCERPPAETALDRIATDEVTSNADGCCPSGCHGCFLECCAGLLSLRPTRVTLLASDAPTAAPLDVHPAPASSTGTAIDRPPRR